MLWCAGEEAWHLPPTFTRQSSAHPSGFWKDNMAWDQALTTSESPRLRQFCHHPQWGGENSFLPRSNCSIVLSSPTHRGDLLTVIYVYLGKKIYILWLDFRVHLHGSLIPRRCDTWHFSAVVPAGSFSNTATVSFEGCTFSPLRRLPGGGWLAASPPCPIRASKSL